MFGTVVFLSCIGLSLCGVANNTEYCDPKPYATPKPVTIDGPYVDGISITYYDEGKRQHVFTYAAGLMEQYNPAYYPAATCPCAGGAQPPLFVRSTDYYCESGNPDSSYYFNQIFCDPLWDGKECRYDEESCCTPPNQPWFCKDLFKRVASDLEIRICSDEAFDNEDIAVESYELYDQPNALLGQWLVLAVLKVQHQSRVDRCAEQVASTVLDVYHLIARVGMPLFRFHLNHVAAPQLDLLKLQPGYEYEYELNIDSRELLTTWLVSVSVLDPAVSRAFKISLPVGGANSTSKTISFTNPYGKTKEYSLSTNCPDILTFEPSVLKLCSKKTGTLVLYFAPSAAPMSINILVFINDELDQTEECFLVNAVGAVLAGLCLLRGRMDFSVFDDLLRYGLYLGAIFQLIAIGAIIFVPPKYDDCTDHLEMEPNGTEMTDVMATDKAEHPENTTAAMNKKGKKVRRRK
eukprot:Em0007g3a